MNMAYIKVFVTPSARRESIESDGETLRICVKEPAERNLANTRVREIVAARFSVPVGDVRILTGHRTRGKMVSINR